MDNLTAIEKSQCYARKHSLGMGLAAQILYLIVKVSEWANQVLSDLSVILTYYLSKKR